MEGRSRAVTVIGGAVVLAGLAIAGAIYLGNRGSGRGLSAPDSATGSEYTLRGVVVLDGAVNGCAGEQATVAVRETGGNVASQIVDSRLEGPDCVFPFALPVPKLDCYELVIDGTPVGRYAFESLEPDFRVGYVLAESVYGNPENPQEPQAYQDWSGC